MATGRSASSGPSSRDADRSHCGAGESTPAPRSSMDFSLTPEQELIRASAREFCEREIAPYARDWDRAEAVDRGLVPKLAPAGYLGPTISEGYGRIGLGTSS